VLKDGRLVATVRPADTDEYTLHGLMVGRERYADYYHEEDQGQIVGRSVMLQVRDLSLRDHYQDVSFEVRKGEVLVLPTLPFADCRPHVPVIDKSKRDDGTFNREDFTFDKERDIYICPAGKLLTTTGRLVNDGETTLLYFASVLDCRSCPLRARCCPKMPARRIPRSIYEDARDVARGLAKTKAFEQSRRYRKKIEMLFAHLKRILRLGRLRLRGPAGAQFEFTLAAIAQNLRRLAKLIARPPPIAPTACVA
jgi:hypothetical protein